MMSDEYPTAEQLSAMGATLQRDVCLWNDALEREYHTNDYSLPNVPAALLPKRNHNKPKGSTPRVQIALRRRDRAS
jgi:hypothetical protein